MSVLPVDAKASGSANTDDTFADTFTSQPLRMHHGDIHEPQKFKMPINTTYVDVQSLG
jgi:hypothetical protein